jgi:hypothetical protein
MAAMDTSTMTGRDRALLRAIADGRCQLSTGCEPVLLIDGLLCADTAAAHRLVRAGLLVAPDPSLPLVPAVLTAAARELLRRP